MLGGKEDTRGRGGVSGLRLDVEGRGAYEGLEEGSVFTMDMYDIQSRKDPTPAQPLHISLFDRLYIKQCRAYTLPPNNFALTVTTDDPIVTSEMTMEKTWMD